MAATHGSDGAKQQAASLCFSYEQLRTAESSYENSYNQFVRVVFLFLAAAFVRLGARSSLVESSFITRYEQLPAAHHQSSYLLTTTYGEEFEQFYV